MSLSFEAVKVFLVFFFTISEDENRLKVTPIRFSGVYYILFLVLFLILKMTQVKILTSMTMASNRSGFIVSRQSRERGIDDHKSDQERTYESTCCIQLTPAFFDSLTALVSL